MKKVVFLSMLFVSLVLSAFSQPLIDQNDMPNIGDTIRVGTTININGIDYTLTGQDFLWDFSSLNYLSQRVDTFVGITSTPIAYQFDFNNPLDQTHKATIAQPRPDINQMPSIQFTDVFNFFKETSASYTQVGFGAKINGVPMPIKYDNPDVLYKFPLTIGDLDSSEFSYNMQIPALGYYGETKKRVNFVDGWGTIITPLDTFHAVRVLSTSYIHDTIHIDSLGIGFPQDKTEKEYKWLTDTMGIPVLKVIETSGIGGGTSVEYIIKYVNSSGFSSYENSLTFFTIYPNPACENTNIYFSTRKSSEIEFHIFDITGRNVKTISGKEFPAGFHSLPLTTGNLQKGIYFIRISDDNVSKVIKLQVL